MDNNLRDFWLCNETEGDPGATPEQTEQLMRMRDRIEQRSRLADRLEAEDADDLAEMLRGCGRMMTLICTCCGSGREVRVGCRKRWCPVCAWQISAKRVARYSAAVKAMRWPLFLTCTRPNVRVLTLDIIREMRRAHRRLRQRKWWIERVTGGVTSIEITNTGKGWHPHTHSVIDCKWLAIKTPRPRPMATRAEWLAKGKQAAAEIGAAWAHALRVPRATVHVKRAYGTGADADPTGESKSIALEVLKYSLKISDLIDSPDPIAPVLKLLGAARLVTGYGSCYGSRLVVDDDDKHVTMCECGATGAWMPDEYVSRWAHAQPTWTPTAEDIARAEATQRLYATLADEDVPY